MAKRVVTGYFNYDVVRTNGRGRHLPLPHHRLWMRTLRRRSQKDRTVWERVRRPANDFLPKPLILHPWPETLRRQTPKVGAVCRTPVRFRAGPASNERRYRDSIRATKNKENACVTAKDLHSYGAEERPRPQARSLQRHHRPDSDRLHFLAARQGQHQIQAPNSFFNAFCYHPPIIGFSSTNWKDSAGNIQETKEFVWGSATMIWRSR